MNSLVDPKQISTDELEAKLVFVMCTVVVIRLLGIGGVQFSHTRD